jgi:hypothetical protein
MCIRMPKPGSRSPNQRVIRFVIARLKAATHLLRNRIRRIGVSRIARSASADVAIAVAVIFNITCVTQLATRDSGYSFAYSVLAFFRMGMDAGR